MRFISVVGCALILSQGLLTCESDARGRIGGGRVGGSRSVPSRGFSGGGISRGSYQSRMPSRSVPSRSSVNRSPSFSQPRTGISRSGIGSSRSIGSGSRTIGSGSAGSSRSGVTIRPGVGSTRIQPGTRPQIGTGNRIGSGSRGSGRVGTGQFPGLGNRSTTALPGLGSGNAGQRLNQRFPDLNRDTLRQQIGDARQSPSLSRDTREAWRQKQSDRIVRTPERQQELNDRLSQVDRGEWQQRRDDNREDRQQFRNDNREDWQQHRDGARDDWQNWYDDHYYHHYGWHHGGWHNDWHDHWDHMWHEHPLAVTFGLTCWGVNTMSYMFGTTYYSNPYYVESSSGAGIDYSQPQIIVQQIVEGDSGAESAAPEAGLVKFEQARAAFHSGNYDAARRQVDEVLILMPHDAVVHEFRALTLFALKRYSDAAAVLHSVLAVGPGWDWTTMSQLYPTVEVYTAQLRELETWMKDHSSLPDGHFVLSYHYLTCGHTDAAEEQLKLVVKALPDDAVSARLLSQLTGEAPAAGENSEPPISSEAGVSIKPEKLLGKWTAKANAATFQLEFSKDGRFKWSFSSQGNSQSISGVYALKDSTLAMEPDGGGVMLAELRLDGTHLSFLQVGADSGASPLEFERD